jgi:hypothetical protein
MKLNGKRMAVKKTFNFIAAESSRKATAIAVVEAKKKSTTNPFS